MSWSKKMTGGAIKINQGVQEKNYRGCTNYTGDARKKFRRTSRAPKILHPLAKCLWAPLLIEGSFLEAAVVVIFHIFLQVDQLDMAMLFWYLVQRDLSSVRQNSCLHWIVHFLQCSRITWPCTSPARLSMYILSSTVSHFILASFNP